ncbi:MAG: hypothetical protein NC048_01190 [Bacteroides sp.]|nr:hypothetical protein [Ruminococcus flavefaciens]MCM1554094.1 hypothetical protein [Bacteroides sp.]
MKNFQRILLGIFSLGLLSAMLSSCKSEEKIENWCRGEWVNDKIWGTSEGGNMVLNFLENSRFLTEHSRIFTIPPGFLWMIFRGQIFPPPVLG